MNSKTVAIAHNYAIAYLNIYGDEYTLDSYEAFKKAALFLKQQTRTLLLLTVPTMHYDQQRKLLTKLFDALGTPQSFLKLVEIIIQEHRILALPTILEQIVKEYQRRKNIKEFTIKSSSPLTDEQLSLLKDFIKNATNATIDSTAQVDPRLIAGIRLQSDNLLWEYSIAQQLRSIKLKQGN